MAAPGNFDTGDQYFDDIFENGTTGISCGFGTFGCAETVPLRTTFASLTTAGITLGNFNALDMWPWYDTFSTTTLGITNAAGQGAFAVYESNFSNDTTADASINGTNAFAMRWNFSTGSNQFFASANQPGGVVPLNLQGNVVLDTTQAISATLNALGGIFAVDNIFRSLTAAVGPVLETGFNNASIFSMANTYTATPSVQAQGEYVSLQDTIVPRSRVNSTAPTLPTAEYEPDDYRDHRRLKLGDDPDRDHQRLHRRHHSARRPSPSWGERLCE